MRVEFLWIAGGRAVVALLGLGSLRVMTHLLDPAQYAVLALLGVFQAFAGLVLINPLGQYINRHTHQWHDDGSLPDRMSAFSRYWLVSALLTGAISSVWFRFRPGASAGPDWLIAGTVVALATYVMTWSVVATARLNMLGERRSSVSWQVIGAAVGLCASWALTIWHTAAICWLAGQVVGAVVAGAGAERALARVKRPTASTGGHSSVWRLISSADFRKFALPLAVTTLLMWVEGSGYRLILERGWSLEDFGLFALALGVAMQLTAFMENIAIQWVFPYFFRGLNDASDEAARQQVLCLMLNTLLPVYLAWGSFLFLGTRPFLELVTDPRYHAAGQWVVFGVMAELARLSVGLWLLSAQAKKNFESAVVPSMLSAVLVVVAAATTWHGVSPTIFGILLVVTLALKSCLVYVPMTRIVPISLEPRRTAVFLGLLLASAAVSTAVPEGMRLGGDLALLSSAALVLGVAVLAHLRTSASAKALFSHRLASD